MQAHRSGTVCVWCAEAGPPSSKSVEKHDEDEDGEGAAVLTRKMVVAMNTVALSATHADSLGQR